MGIPPLALLLTDKQPSDPWTDFDKKLVIAFHIMNKQICNKCGQPIWICRSDNRDLVFSVRKGLCYATRELEKKQEADSKSKSAGLKAGEYYYVVPSMRKEGMQMPSRADWMKTLED